MKKISKVTKKKVVNHLKKMKEAGSFESAKLAAEVRKLIENDKKDLNF